MTCLQCLPQLVASVLGRTMMCQQCLPQLVASVSCRTMTCRQCLPQLMARLSTEQQNCTVQLDSRFRNHLEIHEAGGSGQTLWRAVLPVTVKQHSDYLLIVTRNVTQPAKLAADLVTVYEADDANIRKLSFQFQFCC